MISIQEARRDPAPQSEFKQATIGWAIENSFESAKNELGLDHNETCSWHGWCRNVSLVMLAFAMMAAIRAHANAVASPPKTIRRTKIQSSSLIGRSGDEPIRPKQDAPTLKCNCNARGKIYIQT